MSKRGMRTEFRVAAALVAAVMAAAIAGSCSEGSGRPPLPQHDFACSEPLPNADKLPPMARQQLGLTAQTAYSVKDLLTTEGRQDLWEAHEEGGREAGLHQLREKAALYSITCGPDDPAYRSGVCTNFQLMCAHHGGGGCDRCARLWAAEQCKDLLGKAAGIPIEEAKGQIGYDEEWQRIVATARKLEDPDLLQDLEAARSRLFDDPIEADCYALF